MLQLKDDMLSSFVAMLKGGESDLINESTASSRMFFQMDFLFYIEKGTGQFLQIFLTNILDH